MRDLFLNCFESTEYPSDENSYNPHEMYPEYLWGQQNISNERNEIYGMVRDCLIGLNLDSQNINSKTWNPLGEFISEGDTVIIKPNWVLHYNKNLKVVKNNIECLITHPSIVRAITDYCIIALKGTGKIIIGDAPMQACNLSYLIENSGYSAIFHFYEQHHANVMMEDFRYYETQMNSGKILIGKKFNQNEGIEVKLDSDSRLNTHYSNKVYKVSDYNDNKTNEFHRNGKHCYVINKKVLEADVIINVCKPKCHRLSGMTGAIKNNIGVIHDKACLPHRTKGSVKEGGDEYLNNSYIKRFIGRVLDLKIQYEERGRYLPAFALRYIYGILFYLMKAFSRDKFLLGSWHGNDTIWRTILDIYDILLYADKSGEFKSTRQRKILNFADMIISGEGNGPVSPEPKELGIIVASSDAVMMDLLICNIMGFDYEKIPMIKNSISDKQLISKSASEFLVHSNIDKYDSKIISELNFPGKWKFRPYQTWKGYIEKNEV
jgi:uncharacterized protein (DUF362 family)